MTKLFRHTILLLATISMFVACDDRAIPSDKLGTDGITQSRIVYDTIKNMRDLIPGPNGDTIDIDMAVQYGLDSVPEGTTSSKGFYILAAVKNHSTKEKEQFNPSYGNFYVYLRNKLGNRELFCYRLMGSKGQKFTDLNQMAPGDVVVVYGNIQNYYGSIQLSGGKLVTSDNPLSGYKPDPIVVLSESFDESAGAFTIDVKKAASADVWQHIAAAGSKQGYMCATANINGTEEASESWLVSPAMDLTKCKNGALLTFSHYGFYTGDATGREDMLRLMVSKDGGEWEQLTLDSEMWNQNVKQKRFTEATIDLANYISANTKIAFAYKSDAGKAMTWAVQNIRIGEPKDE